MRGRAEECDMVCKMVTEFLTQAPLSAFKLAVAQAITNWRQIKANKMPRTRAADRDDEWTTKDETEQQCSKSEQSDDINQSTAYEYCLVSYLY